MSNYLDSNNYQEYVCEYSFEGSKWVLTIHARSLEEAQKKLKVVSSGEVTGTLEMIIPAPIRIDWLMNAWIWLKNLSKFGHQI